MIRYLCSLKGIEIFGGDNNTKYSAKRFKQLLTDIHLKSMTEQKDILETELRDWMGLREQIDDILVIGVRF